MRNFILLVKWFLFRRWHLQLLCWDYSREAKRKLLNNMKATDMGGCRIPVIGKDLRKLLGAEDRK